MTRPCRLVASGHVEITQRGEVVDPDAVKGPVRIRRVRPPELGETSA